MKRFCSVISGTTAISLLLFCVSNHSSLLSMCPPQDCEVGFRWLLHSIALANWNRIEFT
jgi:hypothetical protein